MSQDLSQEFQSNRLVGGEGKAYVHFLTTELKPYIDQRFPTKIDDYGIVGSSMGALISFYAFLRYPTIIKKVRYTFKCFLDLWTRIRKFIESHSNKS